MGEKALMTVLLRLEHAAERADDSLLAGFMNDLAEDYGVGLQV
jgi:hypothetical protein